MSAPEMLSHNVQYWAMVLKGLRTMTPSTVVQTGHVLELDDDFFDRTDLADIRWFQLTPGKYDLFLDDSVGTVHLANLSGSVDYVKDDTRLVTWYGHDAGRYDILIHATGTHQPASLPDQRILWFAWDTRLWTLYAHDGKSLIPVFNTAEIVEALDLDPDARIWMGWNGSTVDLFTVSNTLVPENLCAAFVVEDRGVGTVHRKRA